MKEKLAEYLSVVILALLLSLGACERERENPLPDPEYFVESQLLHEFSTNEIINLISEFGDLPPQISFLVNNGVLVYRIIYETVDTDNNPVLASGALIVPDTQDPVPVISFQHGTITDDKDAPSNFSSDQYLTAVLYASAGYIIALPDYLGYGISSQIDHPYEHGRSLASAARDMLRAIREFDLRDNDFAADERLFLTGYSQGGYATMALLKLLEENHRVEFTVTAATMGAGAYNKSGFAREILESNEDLTFMNYFLWVLDTYNKVYDINRPYYYFFEDPYAQIIEQGGVFANTELNPMRLFRSEFRTGVLRGGDPEFIYALSDNDIYDWKPSTPLRMYHGTDDDFVFYSNSLSAFEAMNDRGATQVELITIQGGDHYSSLNDYFTGTFLFFSRY